MTHAPFTVAFFARTFALAALLVATTGCYEASEFYDPAPGSDSEGDELGGDADFTGSDDNDDGAPADDSGDDATDDSGDSSDDSSANGDDADEELADEPLDPTQCVFGEHVSDLAESDDFELGDFAHVFDADHLSPGELDQLEEGMSRFGWTDSVGVDALFSEIDDGRLLVRDFDLLSNDQGFTHFRFHLHGTEYGFLFAADSFRIAAAVDGGDIVACTVPLS